MENLWSACQTDTISTDDNENGSLVTSPIWKHKHSGKYGNDCMIGALTYYLHLIPFRACRSSTLQASPSLCSGHVPCTDHVLLDNHSFRSPPVAIYLSYLN